jgi:hypothetical protein
MAKEIIPPTPVPVKNDNTTINDLYCASFINYSDESFSDTSKELINYLEGRYSSEHSGLGGTTRTFIAENLTMDEVSNDILSANINGIRKDNFDKHIMMNQNDDDVMIFVMLY